MYMVEQRIPTVHNKVGKDVNFYRYQDLIWNLFRRLPLGELVNVIAPAVVSRERTQSNRVSYFHFIVFICDLFVSRDDPLMS